MAYGDPSAGGDLSDWGGGTSGGGGPDPWDPDPEDYRPRASRTPTDYEAEASASTLERFVPPSPPPRDQGVGSLLGDAGQRIKDYMSENWMPNRNLKNPWATALGAITEVPANILAAMFGVPADFQFFSNEDLLGTATQPPGVKFGIPGIVQAQLSGKGLEGIGSFFGNQPLSVDLGGTVKGTGGSGDVGPSPFGPFDLGSRGKADLGPRGKADLAPWERTMNQGIAASKQRMLDQAARTMQQQPGSPDPLNRATIATPLPTGSQVSKPQYSPYRWPNMPPMMPIDDLRRWSQGTEDEQAALRKQYEDKPWSPFQVDTRQPDYITSPTRPSGVLPTGSQVSTEVPFMRGSSQVSTPQLEDRTYVAGWGYMTRDDMMRFNHGTPEEKARIRAKYQR